jgi:hypothetical protein
LTGPNGIITRITTSVFYFIRLQSGGFSFIFKGEIFKNHVTLGIMVNGQKLLGTDDQKRSRYKNERSTVKLK